MQNASTFTPDVRPQALLRAWGVRDFSEELRFLSAEKLLALFHHASSGRVHLQKLLVRMWLTANFNANLNSLELPNPGCSFW